jgi:hypothetical protein
MKSRVRYFFNTQVHFQLSGAFSGLLAAGIENMDGIGGKPGWAWIFILVRFGMLISFQISQIIFIGGTILVSHGSYCLFSCSVYTTRFQVFN